MRLRRSRFIHTVRLSDKRALVINAVTQVRLTIDHELASLLEEFDEFQYLDEAVPILAKRFGYDQDTVLVCVSSLYEKKILTDRAPEEELADVASLLGELHGRDPEDLLDRHRRSLKEGSVPYWAVSASQGIDDQSGAKQRLNILLFGDCDVQMEVDFLRREAARRGIDLRVAATFPDDLGLAGEQAHDAIIIGALRLRNSIMLGSPADHDGDPSRLYCAEAHRILADLRGRTKAPILLDTLPEPTLQPLGFSDQGVHSHRNRFRMTNLALARLAETMADVYVVDIAAALGAVGSERMIDDGLVSFTHFGSPGWMLQRPESEKAAVHGLFPAMAPLAHLVDGNPYSREAVVARTHMDALAIVLGVDRKKCVIMDLDGVMWPGVLAETGTPFAWHPDLSGPFSYIGLYFGIHEALLALKRRGIVLAAVSKNDEATVRELWKYPDHYPRDRLVTPDDFVTWRINWEDKPQNILSIANELGFALDSFVFVDDNPIEREHVRRKIPEIEIWGEDLFSLRRTLLTDPRLQTPRMTEASGMRTELVKAQLNRSQLRNRLGDDVDFIASLNVTSAVERLEAGAAVDRLQELFERTTQFNTTNRKFSIAELLGLLDEPSAKLFILRVSDKFGDHGMVGGAVVQDSELVCFALSCRVIGLGVDKVFLTHILADLAATRDRLVGRLIETPRNIPARNLYRDHGFVAMGDGTWQKSLRP